MLETLSSNQQNNTTAENTLQRDENYRFEMSMFKERNEMKRERMETEKLKMKQSEEERQRRAEE